MVQKLQFAQKVSDTEVKVFHFETDADLVIVENRDNKTLTQVLDELSGKRTYTLSGDVTGKAEVNGSGDVTIETTIANDSHEHTGSTVKVGEAGRVVVTAEDETIIVSEVTSTELGYLAGVTSNIQEQLDDKVNTSETNGNLLIDNEEVTVYKHPDKEGLTLEFDMNAEGVEFTELEPGEKILALTGMKLDEQGHVESITASYATLPKSSMGIHVGSKEPNNQEYGDLWFETLSVSVESDSYYVGPEEGGNKADVNIIGGGTRARFLAYDADTGAEVPMGDESNYFVEPID